MKKSIHSLIPVLSPITAATIGLVGVFVLYQIGGSLLTLAILGFDLENADPNSLRLLTMAGQLLFILLPALVLAKYTYEDVTTALRFRMPKLNHLTMLVIGLLLLMPLFQSYLYIQNYIIDYLASSFGWIDSIKGIMDELDKLVESTYGSLLTPNNFFEGILIILVVAVTPAVCEEAIFRGFVQTSFELKTTTFWAIFITSVFFGMYHFNPYGLIPLVILGMYFGYAVVLSDSIVTGIVLHFLNNFSSVILYFIFGDSEMLDSKITDTENIGYHLIEFAVLAIIFLVFFRYVKNYINKDEVKNDLSEM